MTCADWSCDRYFGGEITVGSGPALVVTVRSGDLQEPTIRVTNGPATPRTVIRSQRAGVSPTYSIDVPQVPERNPLSPRRTRAGVRVSNDRYT